MEVNCEQALVYYKRVASKVAESVKNGPRSAGVNRIHLIEEAEANSGLFGHTVVNTLLDDDLLQYYQFLAEKGDVNAQVRNWRGWHIKFYFSGSCESLGLGFMDKKRTYKKIYFYNCGFVFFFFETRVN